MYEILTLLISKTRCMKVLCLTRNSWVIIENGDIDDGGGREVDPRGCRQEDIK